MSDNPHEPVASRPTESELDLELAELTNWQVFATHLPGVTRGDIEQIREDNRIVEQQKFELFGTWLRRSPDASWKDIVLALEKARELTLADTIKRKFNIVIAGSVPHKDHHLSVTEAHDQLQPSSSQGLYLSSEEIVVEDLKKLHRSFTSLARNIRCKVDQLVKSGKISLHDMAAYIEEAQVCGIRGLTEMNTTDKLFDAIRPHNDYLDCELLEMIVEEYLDEDDITMVKAHVEKVRCFKRTKPIKTLMNKLHQFSTTPIISDSHLIVTIKLQADWGRVTLDFIEKLVQNLLHYRHKVRIVKVESGSVSVMLLLPKEKLHYFIATSSQKLQFMRFTGIFRLQIGSSTILQENEDMSFTFDSALLESSHSGNNEAVQLLLDLGVNVNYSNSEGKTALTLASEAGHEEVVQTLLSAGADINHRDNYGHTALMVSKTREIFSILLQFNADISILTYKASLLLKTASNLGHLETLVREHNNDPNIQDETGQIDTILLFASYNGQFEVVELLLRQNIDPNVKEVDGWTALMFSSQNGHLQVVELLLKHNADPNSRNVERWTPVMLATQNGHLQIVKLLLKKNADPNIYNNDGSTALMFASHNGHLQLAELLMKENANPNIRDVDGWTAVMFASQNDHLHLVELLLKGKVDPNVRNANGSTALLIASQNNHLQVVELLLKECADPNVHDNDGWTAVMIASHSGHLQVVKQLLKHTADLNIRNNRGWTALMIASHNGHLQVVKLLLTQNADPNICNNNGCTALMAASMNDNSDIVETLLQYKANSDIVIGQDIQMSLDSLQIAAIKGNTEAVNSLLNHADLSFETLSIGWYYACHCGHIPIIKLLSNRLEIVSDHSALLISCVEGDLGSVVDQLMSGKMTPDVKFVHGVTPLMVAASCGRTDIVDALIQSSANINHTDDFGDSALDFAECAEQDVTRAFLLQHNGMYGKELEGTSLLQALHDTSMKKDTTSQQSLHSTRQQRNVNISSIRRYLDDSVDTHFSKHQSDYSKYPVSVY